MKVDMKSKKVPYIGLLCSVLFLCVACKDNAFIRRMQDMEMGVKNPSSIEELQSCSPLIESGIFDILPPEKCVYARYTDGGPAPVKVAEQIAALKKFSNMNG